MEILIEMKRVGNIIRVTAMDPESGREVMFQAPASTPHSDLQRLAANKLKYVLKKEE